MSTDTRQDRVTTEVQCLTCGTVRNAPGRVKEHRTIKCDGCGLTTRHRVTVRDGHDAMETSNAYHNTDLRRLVWLESVYEEFGIDVRYDVNVGVMGSGQPALYSTHHCWNQDTGHVWGIEISAAATLAGKISALRGALGAIVSTTVDYIERDDNSAWLHCSKAYGDFTTTGAK